MKTMQRFVPGALVLALAVSISGCDKMGGDTGEAAAKVNDQAISIPQLNRELDKLGKLDPDHAKQAANKVLNVLVEQQLLAQKAVADKLEQDADVKLALEAARTQVLAQAAVEKLTAGVAKPSEQEIGDYFAKHPELFSERRIYRLQEISIPVTAGNAESVKAQVAASHSLDDLAKWLREQNIQARVS
ncbi:MAG: EpsD family peptidyl-prolyl cis-trans isomerase [Pseudomonadota bacterium]